MLTLTNSARLLKLLNLIYGLRDVWNFRSLENKFFKRASGGQLALKEEAAGKVRVFAMVDL